LKEGCHEFPQASSYFFIGKAGRHEAAAAVDVVTHPTGGNYPVLHIEGRHPANGEAISPVDVRHGQGIIDDSRQMGHVGHLFLTFVAPHVPEEALAAVNDPRDPHPPGLGHLPTAIIDLLQHLHHPQGCFHPLNNFP